MHRIEFYTEPVAHDSAPPPFGIGAILVGGGAAIGALVRYGLTHAIAMEPLATSLINVVGCALFGAIAIATKSQPRLALFLGTGFCGGFTTFSAFSLLAISTVCADGVWSAIAIVLVHIVLCPIAFVLGSRGASFCQKKRTVAGNDTDDLGSDEVVQ